MGSTVAAINNHTIFVDISCISASFVANSYAITANMSIISIFSFIYGIITFCHRSSSAKARTGARATFNISSIRNNFTTIDIGCAITFAIFKGCTIIANGYRTISGSPFTICAFIHIFNGSIAGIFVKADTCSFLFKVFYTIN